jgi:ABC-2 type transport system ATP-binding protein
VPEIHLKRRKILLNISHLHKRFGEYTAVEDLSFSMENPGVFALLGTNGAGKTTAIRMILGITARDGGEVLWNGKPLDPHTREIGYLAEERGLYMKYNIFEQMLYFAELKGMKREEAVSAADDRFAQLGLDEYKKKNPEHLSKGNQQKVQLAAALIANPEIIILDEPLSGLDPVNSELFKNVIREEIKKSKYIIMSSHQMATVEEFCEEIVILKAGKAVLQGNLNEIKKSCGRVRLSVKAEENIVSLAAECGLEVTSHTPAITEFYVDNEKKAGMLLKKIVDRNITLIKFEFREPTLHEIFVERAS